MELDDFKKDWQNIKSPEIELSQLEVMINEKNHPVLNGIRKQLILELIGWTAFLLVCFTGLDTEKKPFVANLVLVLAVAVPMLFNAGGYQLSKNLIAGPDLRTSLLNRINLLKRFAIGTVALRVILIAGVGYFFTSTVTLDQRRSIIMAAGALILILPLYLLSRIWIGRIRKLTTTLHLLD